MSKFLVPFLALAGLLGAAAATAPAPTRDRDHDRMPDRWEKRHGLSAKKKSAAKDPDRDHLRNLREFRLRLHPRRRDTDGDGLRDRAELRRWKTNPRKRDTDGDGLSDRAEIKRWKTNPRRPDTDGDGARDGVEVKAGTDPLDPSSTPDTKDLSPAPPGEPGGFPNPSTTGVPAGWSPATTRSSSMSVNTNGAVIQDVLFTNGASLNINADDVTVRRSEFEGGSIVSDCADAGTVIEDVTLNRDAAETNGGEGVISYGGYTARRVEIVNRSEGFRESADPGCVTRIEDSYVHIRPPANCDDWHGDGIQGYHGRELHVRNVTIDFDDSTCGATSPFFYNGGSGGSPSGHAFVNGLLITGRNGYAFRMGTPAPNSVEGLRIQDGSWRFGPILMTDAGCPAVNPWEAKIVTVDSSYRVTGTVRDLPCR
jgi:Bacterial TSP3 repeat